MSKPVVELYQKFGKVRWIDATGDIPTVYEKTRNAMLPQVFFMIGPHGSGKTTAGNILSERTNMHLIRFGDFLKDKGLRKKDDEVKTAGLIKHLVSSVHQRILLIDFPQNEFQAKYFLKNCSKPSRVFHLNSSKDVCQERYIQIGKTHPKYITSAILSKKIKKFHEDFETL